MADAETATEQAGKLSWKFPRTFWFANGAELCERAAYYGMFITLMRYLNQDIGFTDAESGMITAWFASLLYLFPTFMGIMADKIGFKQALMLAFGVLTLGYGLLGSAGFEWFDAVSGRKPLAIIALTLIMLGGAVIKPVISGTVAKTSDDAHRARAMSIFYMVVNIGSFSGKGLAAHLNDALGLQYINFYAAGMTFIALVMVAIYYRNPDVAGVGKTVGEALRGLGRVMLNIRFVALIIIIGGFWAIQGQLYGAMPTYIERLLGSHYKPEWLANINPLVVVICVVPITHLVRHFKPANAIGIGLLIIPFTALLVALAPMLQRSVGDSLNLGITTMHPMILMFIIGIGLQGLAECFLSPKWLEFASKQAPKDEVGLYLGFSHLTTCVSWLFAFIMAGQLLTRYCPDPRTFEPEVRAEWRLATDQHYLFTVDHAFAGELSAGAPLPQGVVDGFAQHDVFVSAEATLSAGVPEGSDLDEQDKWTLIDGSAQYVLYAQALENPETGDRWTELLALSPVAHQPSGKLPAAYDQAHYIWYVFTAVGVSAFLGLLVFKFVTEAVDARREKTA
jgi:dipeptide/tripeptide permease